MANIILWRFGTANVSLYFAGIFLAFTLAFFGLSWVVFIFSEREYRSCWIWGFVQSLVGGRAGGASSSASAPWMMMMMLMMISGIHFECDVQLLGLDLFGWSHRFVEGG